MTWMAEFPDLEEARANARKAMTLPLGMASPLWLAFGAATTAGVAWWWMTRWAKPINLEALTGAVENQVGAADTVAATAAETTETVEEVVETLAAETAAEIETAEQSVEEVAETLEAGTPPSPATPDDLTRLTGIGPKLAAALNARGVTSFAQLAAWTDAEAAAFDADLKLLGRVARDAWIAQAKRLASA
jgi:predicted flap endonuclease-1-like 5' DNA nuclease